MKNAISKKVAEYLRQNAELNKDVRALRNLKSRFLQDHILKNPNVEPEKLNAKLKNQMQNVKLNEDFEDALSLEYSLDSRKSNVDWELAELNEEDTISRKRLEREKVELNKEIAEWVVKVKKKLDSTTEIQRQKFFEIVHENHQKASCINLNEGMELKTSLLEALVNLDEEIITLVEKIEEKMEQVGEYESHIETLSKESFHAFDNEPMYLVGDIIGVLDEKMLEKEAELKEKDAKNIERYRQCSFVALKKDLVDK